MSVIARDKATMVSLHRVYGGARTEVCFIIREDISGDVVGKFKGSASFQEAQQAFAQLIVELTDAKSNNDLGAEIIALTKNPVR